MYASFFNPGNETKRSKTRTSKLYASSELCDQYDSVLSSILDKHSPLGKRVITIRPRAPWYSEEIKEQKVTCHRLERRWRRSRLTSDYRSYRPTHCSKEHHFQIKNGLLF